MSLKNPNIKYLLAADIGGTKTNIGIYRSDSDIRNPVVEETYRNKNYKNFLDLVIEFLQKNPFQIYAATIGVAGPVFSGVVKTTNLDWEIVEKDIKKAINAEHVWLINDLVAASYSIDLLENSELVTLNEGTQIPGGNLAIIAPGTGLGEAFLIWDGKEYVSCPSEGGHVNFAPSSDMEIELLKFLKLQHDHVSYDLLCTGRGIYLIYKFLKSINFADEKEEIKQKILAADDPAPIIVNGALDKPPCKLCVKTLELFTSILGAEAGNLALKVMATNGVYIGGGIPRHILPFLKQKYVLKAFTSKGNFSEFLSEVPLLVIVNPKASLLGAAKFGLENQAVADSD